jgi:hypothetical protein
MKVKHLKIDDKILTYLMFDNELIIFLVSLKDTD